ncbi:MAG: hypothetical protein AW12_02315 [Candidatus Accumulibacter sp. BA-94]|nr:MAG: hypothetical protein AW12_02315 [Candidatus Accumulibacter sp. BA-94]
MGASGGEPGSTIDRAVDFIPYRPESDGKMEHRARTVRRETTFSQRASRATQPAPAH